MVVFLDVPVEKSIELARARDINKSSLSKDIHENSAGHLQNAYRAGKYVGNKRGWNFVNCIKDESLRQVEDIADEIYNLVSTKLKEVK
jgi:dTMP kinase